MRHTKRVKHNETQNVSGTATHNQTHKTCQTQRRSKRGTLNVSVTATRNETHKTCQTKQPAL